MEELIRRLLLNIGEDPEREGLKKTPERVAKAYEHMTQGYKADVKDILTKAVFHQKYDEMVVVKNVELYSLCEHHLLPFFGKCHVAYVPDGKVVGLSKIPRLVDAFARRLQIQEQLTTQIAFALQEHLSPKGVGVIIEARHLCMMMRGVEKQNSLAQTSCMLGSFKSDIKTRAEFLELVGQ